MPFLEKFLKKKFCPKTDIFRFLVNFQKVSGILVTVTLTLTVKNF